MINEKKNAHTFSFPLKPQWKPPADLMCYRGMNWGRVGRKKGRLHSTKPIHLCIFACIFNKVSTKSIHASAAEMPVKQLWGCSAGMRAFSGRGGTLLSPAHRMGYMEKLHPFGMRWRHVKHKLIGTSIVHGTILGFACRWHANTGPNVSHLFNSLWK